MTTTPGPSPGPKFPVQRRLSSNLESFERRHGRPATREEGTYVPLDDLLRDTFLSVLEGTLSPEFRSKIGSIYELSDAFTSTGSEAAFASLEATLRGLGVDEALLCASAFSNMLNLHNLSEEVANSQRERLQKLGELGRGSVKTTNGTLQTLVNKDGVSPAAAYAALCAQEVDLVFTAHPTQALRRSMLKNFAAIRGLLDTLQKVTLTPFETAELKAAVRAHVQSAWRTDEIRRSPPSPQDEARGGLGYFQETIFAGLPKFLRRVDSALAAVGQPRLPLTHSLFKFSSWMAGDRDGNPFVTSECTRDAVALARFTAAALYFKEVEALMFELSMWRASPEMAAVVAALTAEASHLNVVDERKRRNYSDFWRPLRPMEPYRVVLSEVRDRLFEMRATLQGQLSGVGRGGAPVHPGLGGHGHGSRGRVYTTKEDLLEPLMVCYRSLHATGDGAIADGHLLDLIRQVSCFGLSLVRLDVRQESDRHADVMDTITQCLGLGAYKAWPEAQKVAWLSAELAGRRPLVPRNMACTPEVEEALATFRACAEIQQEGDFLGAYVISMTTATSDVLSVALLQRECGADEGKLLRVVPLFERLDDLNAAPAVLRLLFEQPWYMAHIGGRQEVMIGYSDSGKDAGRMAAAWALYKGQEEVCAVGREFGVAITLFHGRGGTVGRGGGPSHLAILSQPPDTINGRLRVTIQGEIIETEFGEPEMCFRTLDLYTAATLEHTLKPPVAPLPEWRGLMDRLSVVSCKAYRDIVFNEPKFITYFHAATPSSELGRMNIGSRPAKRKPNAGIESLRAIPWIFAWTQTRLHLPVWLGIGSALSDAVAAGQLGTLQEMYASWPFLAVTMDMVEMVLAKADPRVMLLYEKELVSDPELVVFGEKLRELYAETEARLLAVTSHAALLEPRGPPPSSGGGGGGDGGAGAGGDAAATPAGAPLAELRRKLDLRTPYITPLNILQAQYLRRQREAEARSNGAPPGTPKDQPWQPSLPWATELLHRGAGGAYNGVDDVILITVKGISAGMQNTG